jgi:hypothetical protein
MTQPHAAGRLDAALSSRDDYRTQEEALQPMQQRASLKRCGAT